MGDTYSLHAVASSSCELFFSFLHNAEKFELFIWQLDRWFLWYLCLLWLSLSSLSSLCLNLSLLLLLLLLSLLHLTTNFSNLISECLQSFIDPLHMLTVCSQLLGSLCQQLLCLFKVVLHIFQVLVWSEHACFEIGLQTLLCEFQTFLLEGIKVKFIRTVGILLEHLVCDFNFFHDDCHWWHVVWIVVLFFNVKESHIILSSSRFIIFHFFLKQERLSSAQWLLDGSWLSLRWFSILSFELFNVIWVLSFKLLFLLFDWSSLQ